MQEPTRTPISITQALQEEAAEIQRFTELLKLEQVALSNGNTEELLVFATQKDHCASRINQLATQRNALLTAQGFIADRPGIEAWCAKNPKETLAASVWTSILSLAREAQELNRLNGELIQMRLQYNNKALEALRGQENSLSLYGPDGQSTGQGQQRINHTV